MGELKTLFAVFWMVLPVLGYAQGNPTPVQLVSIGMHDGGYVIYNYRVQNTGEQSVSRITLGYTGPEESSFAGFDLVPEDVTAVLPVAGQWLPVAIVGRPDGWGVKLVVEADEGGGVGIDWVEGVLAQSLWPGRMQDANAPRVYTGGRAIAPGASANNFSVKLTGHDYQYVHGYASVIYGKDAMLVPVIQGDTTPPALTVTFSPSTIWPPDKKMVSVTATITTTDNYDPQPEIRLESITCNETLAAGDIQGAQIGADVRQFRLRATRTGTGIAGRTYTITYSATDASGNKSVESSTVVVPHDMGRR